MTPALTAGSPLGRTAGLTLPLMDGALETAFSWFCAKQGWPEPISLLSPCCCPMGLEMCTEEGVWFCQTFALPGSPVICLPSSHHGQACCGDSLLPWLPAWTCLLKVYSKVIFGLLFLSFTLLATLYLTHWHPRVGLSAFCATIKSEK